MNLTRKPILATITVGKQSGETKCEGDFEILVTDKNRGIKQYNAVRMNYVKTVVSLY